MIIEVLAGFLLLYLFYYIRFKMHSNYWALRGVRQPTLNPFPFGNNPLTCWDRLSGKINIGTAAYQQYQEFANENIYGTYMLAGCDPVLMLRDPKLIKDVLVKDFDHFVDRGRPLFTTKGNTLTDLVWARQLSSAKGDEWKRLRSMFSPIFTSRKLRSIQKLVGNVVKDVETELAKHIEIGGQVELKSIFERFSMDAMTSCVFGIEADSFRGSKSEIDFVKNAKTLLAVEFRDCMCLVADKVPILGHLLNWLGVPFFKPKQTAFFYETVVQVLRQRLKTGSHRNDLIDLMIEAMTARCSLEVRNNQSSIDQLEQKSPPNGKKERLEFRADIDELDIVATAMTLLAAGFDTTAQLLTFVVHRLALNPKIQTCLQEEIDRAIEENSGELDGLDYNTIQGLSYLDMVINETLRLQPPVSIIHRECTRKYKLRGTNVTIRPGQQVQISILGVHRDPEFYTDPQTFNPENFNKENKAKRNPYTFLAFGHGPRTCVGMRFALLETKACLVKILSSFSFKACKETPGELTRNPVSVFGSPAEQVFVRVMNRHN